jgi:hypothetical protein
MVVACATLTGQCTLRGPLGHHQYGRRSVMSGLYTCDLTGSGSFSLGEVELTREGFTGILWLDNTRYHLAAARVGS